MGECAKWEENWENGGTRGPTVMKLGRRLGEHVNWENVGTDTKGWENVGRKGGKIASPSVRPNYLRAVMALEMPRIISKCLE